MFDRDHPSPFSQQVLEEKTKKFPPVLLRHVRVKCFVKLRDFLISGMPKQVQRKLAVFKN